MKIRIGNDIRLKIQLTFGDSSSANVLSAEAFFVNTTLKNKLEQEYKKKNRFIGRFPIEPFTNEFEPSEYCINAAGLPKYKAYVMNSYNGIGLKPNWKNVAPIKEVDYTVYRTGIERTVDPSIVVVTLPASAQLYEGEYELVVTAKVFDQGYANNERTVTANYKNVFELVSDSQGESVNNPVQIDIVNTSDEEDVNDVYVIAGRYDNNSIHLSRNDNAAVNIDISPITQWYDGD